MKKFLIMALVFLALTTPAIADPNAVIFFSAQTTNATSGYFEYPFQSGRAEFCGDGTWGGATVTLQFKKRRGATAQDVTSISISSALPCQIVNVSLGEFLAATIGGAGTTSLNVTLTEIR